EALSVRRPARLGEVELPDFEQYRLGPAPEVDDSERRDPFGRSAQPREGETPAVRRPVRVVQVAGELPGLATHEGHAIGGLHPPLGPQEHDARSVRREARPAIGPPGERRLSAPVKLLDPDAGDAITARAEGDQAPDGRSRRLPVLPGE